jgi:hypothetical protein
MGARCVLSCVAVLSVLAMTAGAGELAAPVHVLADGQPLDVGGIG